MEMARIIVLSHVESANRIDGKRVKGAWRWIHLIDLLPMINCVGRYKEVGGGEGKAAIGRDRPVDLMRGFFHFHAYALPSYLWTMFLSIYWPFAPSD